MIKFDFSTYINKQIEVDEVRKNEIIEKLNNDKMAGFIKESITEEEINKIINISSKIREDGDIFIVIGIGGSFLGSYAVSKMFLPSLSNNTKVIFIGNDLSSKYLNEVIEYIKDKDVVLNVISKSGTTLEINLTYKILKNTLLKKYSNEELRKRIIITTDSEKGILRDEVNREGYESFSIPSNIGGRYSLMTAAHLLPISVMGLDIKKMISGYEEGLKLIDDAYYYASLRRELFNDKKYIENFSIYESSMYYYTEWIKQLFGETEGKNGKGIFPVSTVNTRDLHSLGQFIQEGNPIIFETVIKVLNGDSVVIDNRNLNDLNNTVCDSVCVAHSKGNVPIVIISLDEVNIETIGCLSAFFMLAAAFSGYLFEVYPFDQPGVEVYKSEINKRIKM